MQKYFFKEFDSMRTQKLKRDEHGRIIISKRTGSTSMINKDTNGRIIIQSRKRNIAADTDPANTANRDLHHDYCLFEQEEDNVIDWGKPSISFKALHLLSNGDKPQTKKDKTKKDKKKKDKQRKKKQKYSYDKVFSKKNKSNLELQTLEEIKGKELTERKICISSVLSEIAAYYKNFLVNPQNEIYIYNEGEGFFEKKSNSEVEAYINSHLTQTQRMKTRPSDISDARKSIYNIQENRSELNNDYDCLVNCQNGVFNIETGDLLEHSIDYKFGRCIQAKYDPDANATVFPEFIKDACNGNEELIWL